MVQNHHEGEIVLMKYQGIGGVGARHAEVVGIGGAGSGLLHAFAFAFDEVATAIEEAALVNEAVVANVLDLGRKER